MPGKGAKERRSAKNEAKLKESIQREKDYLARGGVKSCKLRWNFSRCPVDSDTVDMSCWIYRGKCDAKLRCIANNMTLDLAEKALAQARKYLGEKDD